MKLEVQKMKLIKTKFFHSFVHCKRLFTSITISFYFITNMCVTIYQHDKGFEILLDSLIDVLLDVLPAPIEIL